MVRKRLFLILLAWAGSSCGSVQISEGVTCSVAGKLSAGGICSHLISPATHDLTLYEMIDFLEAQPERECIPVPGFEICQKNPTSGTLQKLPARGAAIIMPAKDWGELKQELELACRYMGQHCTRKMRALLQLP